MSEFEELLAKVAAILEELNIPYLVTGGAAVVFWGRPRFTADIDIVVELSPSEIHPLANALREALGTVSYIDEEQMKSALEHKGEFNVIDSETGIKVDFFIRGDDAYAKMRFARGIKKEIGDQEVTFVSPEDLILIKLQWFKESESTRHLEDAQSVVVIQGDQLDKAYLQEWAERLGISDLLTKILDTLH